MDENTGGKSSLRRFFSNPRVGIVGSIASVVSVLLAVYFYFDGRQYRALTYYVHPAKAVVARTGQSSRLSLSLDQKPLASDVTVVQIAFWNGGKLPIKKDNILAPMTISTSPEHPIIEATLRKSSRQIVDIKIDSANLQNGQVGLSWNILERNDGGVVQLVYVGDAETPITVSGILEGQPEIHKIEASEEIKGPLEQYETNRRQTRTTAISLIIASMVFFGSALWLRRMSQRFRHIFPLDRIDIMLFCLQLFLGLAALIGGCLMFRWYLTSYPPFGF